MYKFCAEAPDPLYAAIESVRDQAPGESNHSLPNTFGKWIDEWYTSPRFGDYTIYQDDEGCYCPYNLQASRLACLTTRGPAKDCHKNVDMDRAMTNLNATSMLGVTEAYHESMCLFHAHLLGSLPDHCNCESPAWDTYHETKDTHGGRYLRSVDEAPSDVIQKVDDITKDDQVVYRTAVQRFITDVEAMGQRFGVKILCPARREMLLAKAASA
eukprot:Skav233702  [mRNA]  locus=scaffold1927:424700:425338:+ [translate_table: standard]